MSDSALAGEFPTYGNASKPGDGRKMDDSAPIHQPATDRASSQPAVGITPLKSTVSGSFDLPRQSHDISMNLGTETQTQYEDSRAEAMAVLAPASSDCSVEACANEFFFGPDDARRYYSLNLNRWVEAHSTSPSAWDASDGTSTDNVGCSSDVPMQEKS